MQTITTSPDDPFYAFTVNLGGRDYVFDFRYNQRENAWYFSIALPDGTELANGVKVVCRTSLIHRWSDVRLPPGLIMAIANGDDESPPGIGELGEDRRVTLCYLVPGESLT